MSDTEHQVDSAVEMFVQRYVGVGEETIELKQVWKDYETATAHPVPRERFKWHFSQALPDEIERKLNTFRGVDYDFPCSLNTESD